MILFLIEIVGGCLLLGIGANWFITCSSSLAQHYRFPPLVTGLLLVGFGTSFPEWVVTLIASLKGNQSLAIGNVLGSNNLNIGLVIALGALVRPIVLSSSLLKREFPILLATTVMIYPLMCFSPWSHWQAIILIVSFIVYLIWTLKTSPLQADDPLANELTQNTRSQASLTKIILGWLVGLLFLLIASELLLLGATQLAQMLHISDLVIGLTVVALGTSLPELATTCYCAYKGEHEMAIGNIIGSNLFNLLAVLPLPGLIHPSSMPSTIIWRDYPIVILFTLLFFLCACTPRKKPSVSRSKGLLLLCSYCLYTSILYLQSTLN